MFMSRKYQRVRVLLASLVIFPALLLCYHVWEHYSRPMPEEYVELVMAIPVVDNITHLDDKRKISLETMAEKDVHLLFEDTILPMDSKGYVYISQGMSNEWVGNVGVNDRKYYVCMLKDEYLYKKSEAIQNNHSFQLYIVGEQEYCEAKLVVSGMPIVSINTERSEEQPDIPYEVDPDKKYYGSETLFYGDIVVYNPDINVDAYEILEARVRYHGKGASTAGYPKGSYSISLQNYKEENIDTSLLGMRSDNSWKLNALYADESRIREKTASDIWEMLDQANKEVDEPGPRMEYVELILDNQYQGIYCLVEPVDEKKLGLDHNDVLYKIIDWEIQIDENMAGSAQQGWRISYPIRIRYPDKITDYNATWSPFREYMNIYYRDADAENVDMFGRINISNVVDMAFFTMVVSGSDNYYKNMYYAAKVDYAGEYVIYQLPWDLDLTFGNVYCYDADRRVTFSEDYTSIYLEQAFQKLAYYYPKEIRPYVLERWEALREDVLATETIQNLMIQNQNYLIRTGAMEREGKCWPDGNVSEDISGILDFQQKRMDWLDETCYDLWSTSH